MMRGVASDMIDCPCGLEISQKCACYICFVAGKVWVDGI